jgi:hypothetical protein
MKSSNLAERLYPGEQEFELAAPGPQQAPLRVATDAAGKRPRRSLEFRAIVIRDQGFTPFRVS